MFMVSSTWVNMPNTFPNWTTFSKPSHNSYLEIVKKPVILRFYRIISILWIIESFSAYWYDVCQAKVITVEHSLSVAWHAKALFVVWKIPAKKTNLLVYFYFVFDDTVWPKEGWYALLMSMDILYVHIYYTLLRNLRVIQTVPLSKLRKATSFKKAYQLRQYLVMTLWLHSHFWLMIADTGHIRYVSCYRLDLLHKRITNVSIVL